MYYSLRGWVFEREQHRHERHDLARFFANPQMEYVNQVLDDMIQTDPSKRCQSLDPIAERLREVRTLLSEHYYPVDAGSKCRICGEGTYERPISQTDKQVILAAVGKGGSQTRIDSQYLRCRTCGVLLFFPKHKEFKVQDPGDSQKLPPTS